MLAKLFRSKPRQVEPAIGSLPAGMRVYAVGDIHGRRDLLDALLARIDDDDAARGPAATQIVLLGDLVDRGPDSAGVVARAIELARSEREVHLLTGNHEEVFLRVLAGDERSVSFFCRIGGFETLLSYGIEEQDISTLPSPELIERIQAKVPREHADFLRSFEDMVVLGDYAFVHAGIMPDTPLANQKISDLRWIREDFLNHRGAMEKIVVHGHTISDDVEQQGHRIGIDTGAYRSGRLSAMGFEGSERWVLQTEPEAVA